MSITLKNAKQFKEECQANKDCLKCKNRELCKLWLKTKNRYTPCQSNVNDLLTFMKSLKIKVDYSDEKQVFYNSNPINGFKTTHACKYFYNRLKLHYCRDLGYKIQKNWLDFQEFAKYWEQQNNGNFKKPKFNSSCKFINTESVTFV